MIKYRNKNSNKREGDFTIRDIRVGTIIRIDLESYNGSSKYNNIKAEVLAVWSTGFAPRIFNDCINDDEIQRRRYCEREFTILYNNIMWFCCTDEIKEVISF